MRPESDRSSRKAGQRATVLVVGAGALGCAAARTLAADASVAIHLLDDDVVELSNLQRQVLYSDADIGRRKVDAAAASLAREFPEAIVETEARRLDATNGAELVAAADLVIDGTDDPATKFLLNRLCVEAGKPYVHGGVARTGGQWLLVLPGESACLECVFPPAENGIEESAAGCSALGILAPVAGFVGSMQAATALAHLRHGVAKAGRLHVYELAGARSRRIDFPPRAKCFCAAGLKQQGIVRRRAS